MISTHTHTPGIVLEKGSRGSGCSSQAKCKSSFDAVSKHCPNSAYLDSLRLPQTGACRRRLVPSALAVGKAMAVSGDASQLDYLVMAEEHGSIVHSPMFGVKSPANTDRSA